MTGPFGFNTFAHRPVQMNENAAICSDEQPDYAVSAHAEAAARLLCAVVRQLRTGTPPEELGAQVVALGEMMERRI